MYESKPIIYIDRSEIREGKLEDLKVAGPAFSKFVEFIKLLRIDVYGNPGDDLLEQMQKKAQLLGNGTVVVHELQAGFARFCVLK